MLDRLSVIFTQVMGDDFPVDRVSCDSRITSDLGLNSVSLLYLVLAIEEEFGVSFSNESISSFETVGDICRYLEKNATK
ncbi:MAG: phosphopantetheine-binding protein [Clostridia bacterium]|nr:phosphopantetheine-binding protein [Clostridia bacterium]